MTRISFRPVVLLLAASSVILAQQTAPTSNPGWRRVGDPPPAPAAQSALDQSVQDQSVQDQSAPIQAQDQQPASRDAYGQIQQPAASRPPAAQAPRPAYGLPAQVTLKPGTFVTMRISQGLASNKNSAGDTFSGALTQPIVVDGIVVAQRGQMVYGRVAEADKVKGVHRLGIELTGLALADGSQASVHTQLISRQGPVMPYGYGRRDDGVITTATADGSTTAGTIGVLATKGHESRIYPETVLTFQTGNAVTIATGNSNGAFRYVSPDDYTRPSSMTQTVATRPAYGAGYPYYPYYGWGSPYGWGYPYVGFGFGFGGFGGFRGGFRR